MKLCPSLNIINISLQQTHVTTTDENDNNIILPQQSAIILLETPYDMVIVEQALRNKQLYDTPLKVISKPLYDLGLTLSLPIVVVEEVPNKTSSEIVSTLIDNCKQYVQEVLNKVNLQTNSISIQTNKTAIISFLTQMQVTTNTTLY